ncbi:unnamed protein product [Trichobilharzia szidati]|nr:unnamed protein product [Trichobilharzia szidati]
MFHSFYYFLYVASISDTESSINHDNLSIHHFNIVEKKTNTSAHDFSDSDSSCMSSSRSFISDQQSTDHFLDEINADFSGPIDVDLGANYLIGCSNRQAEQPLFHLASMLKIPTAVTAGDLCKKYRGWECVEVAEWLNHYSPQCPITANQVAEGVFLFDRVTHLTVDRYLEMKSKAQNLDPNMSVKELYDQALQDLFDVEVQLGYRSSAAFRDPVEEGIFQSIVSRYLAYVNPMERLPLCILDDLCEVTDSKWQSNVFGEKSNRSKYKTIPSSLALQLVQTYPTADQRRAYHAWAERKLDALRDNEKASLPSVTKTVCVSWEDRLVTSRFGDVLNPLLKGVNVIYNAVVTEIDWSKTFNTEKHKVIVKAKVRRQCQSTENQNDSTVQSIDEEEQIYEAKHCIITVPVGVLKGLCPSSAITFHPQIPIEKRKSIERLGMPCKGSATHEKVILRFKCPEDVFWDTRAALLKCPDPRLHILNLHRYGKPGVLCAHLWGGSGINSAGRTDKEVVDIILDLLDGMYGKNDAVCTLNGNSDDDSKQTNNRRIPNPVYYLVTRWSEDPFALGAYTTGEPGCSDIDRSIYAKSLTGLDARNQLDFGLKVEPNGDAGVVDSKPDHELRYPRLLFAGEGTLTSNEAKECTHGALQTGIARAIQLLPYLMKSKCTIPDPYVIRDLEILESYSESNFSSFSTKLASYLVGKVQLNRLLNCNIANGKQFRRVILTRSTEQPLKYSPNNNNNQPLSDSDYLINSSKSSAYGQRRRYHNSSKSYWAIDDGTSCKCCTYPSVKRARVEFRRGRKSRRVSYVREESYTPQPDTPVIKAQRGRLPRRGGRVGLCVISRAHGYFRGGRRSRQYVMTSSTTGDTSLSYQRANSTSRGRRGRPRKRPLPPPPPTYETTGTSWNDVLTEEDREETLFQLTNLLNEFHSSQKSKDACVTSPEKELVSSPHNSLVNGDYSSKEELIVTKKEDIQYPLVDLPVQENVNGIHNSANVVDECARR